MYNVIACLRFNTYLQYSYLINYNLYNYNFYNWNININMVSKMVDDNKSFYYIIDINSKFIKCIFFLDYGTHYGILI